jgi:hypothetical protein
MTTLATPRTTTKLQISNFITETPKGWDKYRTIGEFDNCHFKFQKWS